MKQKLIFIGNGFDLNLGLKTSYKDFLNSSFFEELLNTPNANPGPHLTKELKKNNEEKNWVDIEIELSKFSKNKANEHFLSEYRDLCRKLTEYIESIQKCTHTEPSPALEFITSQYNVNNKTTIINFNYTNTVQNIFQEMRKKSPTLNTQKIPMEHYHIHGSVKNNDIIFGVDDKHEIGERHIEIRKSTFNDKGGRIIKKSLRSADDIYFFGLSLGETDHMYFRDFFEGISKKESDKRIHFYHYGRSGRLDLHNQFEALTNRNVTALKSNNEFFFKDVSPKTEHPHSTHSN